MNHCSRINCKNSSTTFIPTIGHVCEDCQREFKVWKSELEFTSNSSETILRELPFFIGNVECGLIQGEHENFHVDLFFKEYA